MRIIIGISGASGVVMGYCMLKALKQQQNVETHLVITEGAIKNFAIETNMNVEDVTCEADYHYSDRNLAAPISSGSFRTDGMIVVPCSMKSLSGIVNSYDANLLVRAADVCLKEGRKVVLLPREMPLNRSHLRNLQTAAEDGCVIIPPMLTFYNNAVTLEQQINHIIGKVLGQFGLLHQQFIAWEGKKIAA